MGSKLPLTRPLSSVKNSLAIVQSLAYQTFKGTPAEDARRAFEGRLITLANSHTYLTSGEWEGTRLRDLLMQAFSSQGVAPARVAILGGGVSGVNAAQMAVGMRADVTIYDISNRRLAELDMFFGSQIKTAYASKAAIAAAVEKAHLVIGAVLVPGAAAPKLVTRDMLKTMKRGSVLVDIAIDQGGCFETSHATTHDNPVFEVDGVIHYCVANMPGAVARTSAFALNNATLPFALRLANMGAEKAMAADKHLANGLNVSGGKIRHAAVAEALDLPLN